MTFDDRLLSFSDGHNDPFWGGRVDRHNATNVDDDQITANDSSGATVLVLGMLVFLMLTCAVACVQVDSLRRQEGSNSASDGNTVASVQDIDVEEGPDKASDEDKGGPMVIVIRVVDG